MYGSSVGDLCFDARVMAVTRMCSDCAPHVPKTTDWVYS